MTPELIPLHVEIYLYCVANPCFRIPGGADAARVFVVDMERNLSGLDPKSRELLVLEASGYTHSQIARKLRCSISAVAHRSKDTDLLPRSWETAPMLN